MKKYFNKRFSNLCDKTIVKSKVKGILFIMCLMFLYPISASPNDLISLQNEITGTVSSSDNQPLPGVTILVAGTNRGTVSDFDGNYSIAASQGEVLAFSYIGMSNREVTVGADNMINVVMQEDVNALDEIIVVGYETRKKKDITSSVSQISSKELEASVQASPEFALQGTTSGILVQSASGDPNARPTIRIRGVGTTGFNDPLYVIDGVPVSEFGAGVTAFASPAAANDIRGSQNILNLINPNDIASISVLKDAAATAVYGMRASNGVILIETKRGKGSGINFNFNTRVGYRNIRKKYDLLNTAQYTSYLTESYNNAGIALPAFLDPSDAAYLGGGGKTYDWQSAIENRAAITQDYNFSAESKNDKSNFYFSGGYSKQASTLLYNSLQRYTATLTSDFRINDWLKLGESLRIAYTDNDDSKGTHGSPTLASAIFKPPWQPIFDANDEFGFAKARDAGGNLLWGAPNGTGVNDVAVGALGSNRYRTLRNLGTVYAEITPLKGLLVKGTLGLDWSNIKRERIRSKKYFPYHINSNSRTDYLVRNLTNWSVLSEILASYTKAFGNHNFNFLTNFSFQEIGADWTQAGAVNPIFDDLERVSLSPSESQAAESFKDLKKLSGSLFKFSYNFDSRYYLDGSYRRDGTSVFAPGNRFGDFFGASAAWRVSDEKFMENVSWINDLKFRASWGQTGNQETAAFSYLGIISSAPRLSTTNDTFLSGTFQRNIPNENLTWETSTTTNFGLDATLFDYRLTFSAEYFDRLTEDILQPFPLPITAGIRDNPVANLAAVSNKGIEIQLGWNDKIGADFEYDFGFNLTTVNNNVVKLTEEAADGRIIQNGFYGTQVGESIGFIYGYEADGIFQTQAEVDNWKSQFTDEAGSHDDISPGDMRFVDLFGNPSPGEFKSQTPDGVINDNDRTVLGKTIPGYYYGIQMGAKYKSFDLSLQWQGVGDVQKVNQVRASGESLNPSSNNPNQLASVLDRWTPNNPSTTIPRALAGDPVRNTRFSSRFVEDADYLRLQNIQLGYNFDRNTLDKVGVKSLRLYLSGSNIALITGYSGLDPEVNLFSDTDFSPPPRILLLGMNLTF